MSLVSLFGDTAWEDSMNTCSRLCLLVGLAGLLAGSPPRLRASDTTTRTFDAQKCRYTLPGPDWSWSDEKKAQNMPFMARSTKGHVINLSVVNASYSEALNEQYGKEVEKSLYKTGQFEKRGDGKIVPFRGLQAYQAEMRLGDGRTCVLRVFTSRGFHYQITQIGTKEPVEIDPTFEKIMDGFDFTVSAEATAKQPAPNGAQVSGGPAGASHNSAVSEQSGSTTVLVIRIAAVVVVVCIVLAVVLFVIQFVMRKLKAAKK
jgi:hypothetical protein